MDPDLNFTRLDELVMDLAAQLRREGDDDRAEMVAASMASVRETLRNPGDLAEALQEITDATESLLRVALEHSGRINPGDPVR
ncbi:hypothetical protein [Micromonospora sp. HUAS LYJ1]|uniref:hypothetical protein n=1 Tax=Micromonospora sp. HUAS LYJ1 TaxID=3061626 RepID=UPI002673165C|nr:hypothetical protein [Micromonospora sp. HUAS LYJ1]WKU07163.1 hypothetical protein Q2K16_08970 [Micromonospora sp. HUAS LYJ1]